MTSNNNLIRVRSLSVRKGDKATFPNLGEGMTRIIRPTRGGVINEIRYCDIPLDCLPTVEQVEAYIQLLLPHVHQWVTGLIEQEIKLKVLSQSTVVEFAHSLYTTLDSVYLKLEESRKLSRDELLNWLRLTEQQLALEAELIQRVPSLARDQAKLATQVEALTLRIADIANDKVVWSEDKLDKISSWVACLPDTPMKIRIELQISKLRSPPQTEEDILDLY